MIRHVVLFSARDPADLPAIETGLRLLERIGCARLVEVGRNLKRDQASAEIDVMVYAEFDDAAALEAFKSDPLYEAAIAIVRPLRDRRIVADIEAP